VPPALKVPCNARHRFTQELFQLTFDSCITHTPNFPFSPAPSIPFSVCSTPVRNPPWKRRQIIPKLQLHHHPSLTRNETGICLCHSRQRRSVPDSPCCLTLPPAALSARIPDGFSFTFPPDSISSIIGPPYHTPTIQTLIQPNLLLSALPSNHQPRPFSLLLRSHSRRRFRILALKFGDVLLRFGPPALTRPRKHLPV
jgi:hypothetical protein